MQSCHDLGQSVKLGVEHLIVANLRLVLLYLDVRGIAKFDQVEASVREVNPQGRLVHQGPRSLPGIKAAKLFLLYLLNHLLTDSDVS